VIDPGCASSAPYYRDFLTAVRAAHVPFQHPRPGQVLTVADVRLDVLGPMACAHHTHSDPNNDSLVLRLTQGPNVVLLTGDAEVEEQGPVLAAEAGNLMAPLMKVPHHGGNTNTARFLAAVHAQIGVVSVGQPNPYGHPSPALLAQLRADGIRVFRTDRLGDVTVRFVGGAMEVRTGSP
jgi:competence protein ComEC